MQSAIARARVGQENRLQAMAIDALSGQKERLAAYRVQAQFALATIYDRAATAARNDRAVGRAAAPAAAPIAARGPERQQVRQP